MAKIREIKESDLFQGIVRNETIETHIAVCKTLDDIRQQGQLWNGLFSCTSTGVLMGAKLFNGQGQVVHTVGPNPVASGLVGNSSDIGILVGMVGDRAANFVKETNPEDPESLTSQDLFEDRVGGEVAKSLRCDIEENDLVGRPKDLLLGICDKMKWIRVNDEMHDTLTIDWEFTPLAAKVGATVYDTNGEVVKDFPPVSARIAGTNFYSAVGEICNRISLNAVLYMAQGIV